MNKCMASENGICQNVHAHGIKCNGFSEKCKLKPLYDYWQNVAQKSADAVRRTLGIVGDEE